MLRELEQRGPLLSRELEHHSARAKERTVWWGTRAHLMWMLELLHVRGRIAIAGRRSGQRLWDLAERWYPETETVPAAEARRLRDEKRFRSLGVKLERGRLVAHPEATDGPVSTRVTFLSPFDRLVHDRNRAEALWDFFYRLEMYVPKAKRVHGYYVLPILRGDRLIGRIEPVFDRKTGVLRVNGALRRARRAGERGPRYRRCGAKAVEMARRRRDRVLPARARDVASLVQLSLADARRMAIAGQLLPAPKGTSILDVAKHIGYLQLDPTRAVERNHLLVLWSRLGAFELDELQRLREERALYEYSAAIVATDDYPLHQVTMRRFPAFEGSGDWNQRLKAWLADNSAARRKILAELRRNGPLGSRDLGDVAVRSWASTGWTNERNISRLLELLSLQGKVLVSGRQGGQRLWDLPNRVVPEHIRAQKPLTLREAVHVSADRSLRGLGMATPQEVRLEPWVGGPYPGSVRRPSESAASRRSRASGDASSIRTPSRAARTPRSCSSLSTR